MNSNTDFCRIEIKNFRRYQPRTEYKSMPWLRLDAHILEDHVWSQLPHAAFTLWVRLLCACAHKNAVCVTVDVRLIAASIRLKPFQVRDMIDTFERFQMLTVLERSWQDRIKAATKRTNETNETNGINAPSAALKTRKRSSSSTRVVKENSLQTEFDSAKTEEPQQPAEVGKQITTIQQGQSQQPNLLGAYYDLWRSRYGDKLARKPADGAILKRIAKVNGPEQTLRMLEAFFMMPDAWAVKKAHDLFTFERMLSEVVRFMNSGKVFTNTATKEADEEVHFRQKNLDEDRRFIEENPHLFENRRTNLLEG